MSTYLDRLIQEKDELQVKVDKLESYTKSSVEIHSNYYNLLVEQYAAMVAYRDILDLRIRREEEQTND